MIVALDQEKAYNKIDHEYLWKTMHVYNLPKCLINTIKSLYELAETVIIINGVTSPPSKSYTEYNKVTPSPVFYSISPLNY